MLYRIIGPANSGTSFNALDRIVNSQYENALYITNENLPSKILNRLKSYEKNTNKIIVNKIKVKAIPFGEVTDDTLEVMLDDAVLNGHDCVLIDKLSGISSAEGECVISHSVFYDDLCERLANFSKDNDIDIIVVQQANRDSYNGTFDEAMKNFSKNELQDGQEHVMCYKSNLENGTQFVKVYERRNNLIRNFNINQYFDKKLEEENK